MQRSAANNIGTIIKLIEAAEVVGAVKYSERGSRLDRCVAGNLLTAENLAVYTVAPAKQAMAGSDG